VENRVASLDSWAICNRSNLTAWSACQATDGWIKVVEIKKIDSSTRSSVRKSGKKAEMLEVEKVGVKGVF
jgi:hypothetical protein